MATCQSLRPSETGGKAPALMVILSRLLQTGSIVLSRPDAMAVLEMYDLIAGGKVPDAKGEKMGMAEVRVRREAKRRDGDRLGIMVGFCV